MYETTYPIDTAAEMLGCQQKKIMTEWAKGTIQIVLDFGQKDKVKPASYEDVDAHYNRLTPWNIADISAPAKDDFFPTDLLNPKKEERPLFFFDADKGKELVTVFPSLYHEYSQSGFYFDHKHSRAAPDGAGVMLVYDVLLYGLWVVPYSEFSRVHVQDTFTLQACSPNAAFAAVAATFKPGIGSRRINAPEKKNLRITESDMGVMRKMLAKRPGHQQAQTLPEEQPEQSKSHGGIERFALEREKILAAALYVAHHFPKETGKTFKSHADCIDKRSYLFWKDEPAPDPERVAKILSDATRIPDEWKILGGNAKSKK
ncbi:TPA: hypothetical protein ACTZGN_000883 [Raoultella ornithinolytica]